MPLLRRAALGAVLALTFVSSARAADDGPNAYTVDITGEPSGRVSDLIERSSQLLALLKRPPPSPAALGRRISEDEDRIRAVLESGGYYGAEISTRAEEKDNITAVKIEIASGPLYTLRSLKLDLGPSAAALDLPVLRDGVYLESANALAGKAARATEIIAAEDAALAALRAGGFAFARRGDRGVVVDDASRAIDVILPVELGPHGVFGAVRVHGDTDVSPAFIDSFVSWTPGMRYDARRLERLRLDLITAGLYSAVMVAPAPTEGMPDGAPVDIDITVRDALHRTFGAGATYARDKGAGASAFWEHRNILGGGERLRASIEGTELDQTATIAFSKPGFLARRQLLKLGVEGRHADTAAYREWGSTSTAALERELSDTWTVGGGASLDLGSIEDNGVSRSSYLAGLPLTATWSTTDRLTPLDPVKGWRVALAATPFAGDFEGTVAFLKSEAQVSIYVPMDTQARTVIAARVKAGSIVGAATSQVPANRRFYAGGGGSIRGFGYQLIGPLDADLTPSGARSVFEGSIEARYRFSSTIGVVPFIDAGMASRSSVPGNARLRAAAGIGGRYYTPVGPLRVDVAVPLNRRPGVDKSYQFYISFGQAF